jgi:nuclear transcription Y subunit beta
MASEDTALDVQSSVQKLMSSKRSGLDKMIPAHHIHRIMQEACILEGDDVPKRTREFVQICVSRFLSQVVSEALKKCRREDRKAITADDLVWSLSHSSLACYADTARDYTHRYRALEANEKLSKRLDSQSLLVFTQATPLATKHDLSEFSFSNKPQTSRNASALRSAAQARDIWQKATALRQTGDARRPAPAPRSVDAAAGGVTVGNAESDDELFALAEHAAWEHKNINVEEWHELPLFPSLTAGPCTHRSPSPPAKKHKV